MADPRKTSVVIAATLDTKGAEVAFVRRAFEGRGVDVVVIDCGILGTAGTAAEFTRAAVAKAGGGDIDAMRDARDRAAAFPVMVRGLETVLRDLRAKGRIAGYFGMGGGTNAALASAAFALLPFGIPKMLVSTVACGNTRPFIGMKDVMLVHSVVDILGLNAFLEDVLLRAVASFCAALEPPDARKATGRPVVGMTTFGSTTEGAMIAHDRLVERYDVLSFHARGIGGEAMEAFVREGRIHAVLDLTTTEIADELVGGVCSAGPGRLDAAAETGIPQVVLPGAIDMVNFGPRATVPERFAGRTLTAHTQHATLMRTTADENVAIAKFMARKLNAAKGPVAVVLPLRGFSAYDVAGGPFFEPKADMAFCDTLIAELASAVAVERIDAHINERPVVERAVALLHDMMTRANKPEGR